MQVNLAKTAGFCFGVDRAVNLVYDLLNKGEKVCTLGPIIHNHQLVGELKCSNIKFINATCPFVLKIHKIVSEQPDGTVTLIAGDENHPEVLGIRSYCKGESFVFKNEDELKKILENLQNSGEKSVICVSQTTFSLKEWKKCEKIIKKLYTNCKIYSTICNATADRQEEAFELSKKADAMIVICGMH